MTPINFVPDTAPFTPEQRAWLNGFFTGIYGVDTPQSSLPIAVEAIEQPVTPVSIQPEKTSPVDDDDFPWHDPSLDMQERLELAKDRPLRRQLMAAMAQLDCGACGYDCRRYSEALANGEETCANLCVPGGIDTEEQLEKILAESRALPVVTAPVGRSQSTPPPVDAGRDTSTIGFDRKNPIEAEFLFARPLNLPGSRKDTRQVAVELISEVPAYRCGDALGVYPFNDLNLVQQIIASARFNGNETIVTSAGSRKSLIAALCEDYCLRSGSEAFSGVKQVARESDLLEVIQASNVDWNTAQEFVDRLRPLQPRLYSISSSPRKFPNQVHLTVARVQSTMNHRIRLGVASTMFADRLKPRQRLKVFLHRPQAFSLPQSSDASMIMVGPGTGIAPFISFLQDRECSGSRGKNWLFFGEQHASTDFLYEEQVRAWQQSGVLNRLDTAFSRDQEEKVYVQDRLIQNGRQVYEWLQEGAYFYVCGDAKSMASSVQNALQQIIVTHGSMSVEEASEQIKLLQKQQRIQRDVY